jgi:hypothetical protein
MNIAAHVQTKRLAAASAAANDVQLTKKAKSLLDAAVITLAVKKNAEAWGEAVSKIYNAGFAAGSQGTAEALNKYYAENPVEAEKGKGSILTVRSASGRAVGIVVSKSKTAGVKAHRVVWKLSADGKTLRLTGTEEFEPGKRFRSVAAAAQALLKASEDLVEPTKPSFVISRSNPDGDEILI